MTAHALLSASSAHRWLHCTAAPRLEAKFPDTTSEYAVEGSLAHAICELKLLKYCTAMSQRTYSAQLNKMKKNPLYQTEMDGYTDDYINRIKQIALSYDSVPHIVAERKVSLEKYVPQGFGTADCILIHGTDLHIFDFKYGKGVVVDAVDNPQMRLYALGALDAYRLIYHIETVHMHIVQPRISNYSDEDIKVDDLDAWGQKVAARAAVAFGNTGTFNPGEWCKFCRAKAQCRARAEHYAALSAYAQTHPDPRLLSLADLGKYLVQAKELEFWAKDLQDFALSSCLAGKDIPGWKAVEGRGIRTFTDQEAAFKILMSHGIAEAVLYERVPLSLAKAEKAVGKKEFEALVGEYVIKNPGKPTLAPESDKRTAISNLTKAIDVFNPVNA